MPWIIYLFIQKYCALYKNDGMPKVNSASYYSNNFSVINKLADTKKYLGG